MSAELARSLALVAADLDAKGYPAAGVVRRAAQLLLDPDDPKPGTCRGCNGPVPTNPTGRPRQWCTEACRRRHRPRPVSGR